MCQTPRCQRFVGLTKGHITPLSAFFPLTFSSIPLSPKTPLFWFFPPDRATSGRHPEIWWLTDFRYQRMTGSSWRTGRGRTYSVGDLYFMDFLKRRSVKERQLPVALVFLHRRPRYDEPIVGAKTAVGPYRDRQTSAVQNPKLPVIETCIQTERLTLQSSWSAPWPRSRVAWSSVCPTLSTCHHLESRGRHQVN